MNSNNLTVFDELFEIDNSNANNDFIKISWADLVGIGGGVASLHEKFRTITSTMANSQRNFRAVIPEGAQLLQAKDSSGFISAIKTSDGLGQGRFLEVQSLPMTTTLPVDPMMLSMMVMVMNIEHKLNDIQEDQEKIISTLETQKHGEIKGNIKLLYDIVKNFKINFDDINYKNDYRNMAQHIKKDAYEKIETYKERIVNAHKVLNNKFVLSFTNNKLIKELADDLMYHRLSVFMASYALYVELILGNNYNGDYINLLISKLDDFSFEYRDLYSITYDLLEVMSNKSTVTGLMRQGESMLKGLVDNLTNITIGKNINVGDIFTDASENIEDFRKDLAMPHHCSEMLNVV